MIGQPGGQVSEQCLFCRGCGILVDGLVRDSVLLSVGCVDATGFPFCLLYVIGDQVEEQLIDVGLWSCKRLGESLHACQFFLTAIMLSVQQLY